MSKFLFGVFDLVKTEYRNAMLLGDMYISGLMTHAQQVEGDKLRELPKNNKKAITGNYEYSQQKSDDGNCSQFQQRSTSPAPSSASAPSSRFQLDQKGRALGCRSHRNASGNNNTAQSTAPVGHPTQQGTSSGTSGGQCQNKLYALQASQDHEDSPDIVTEYVAFLGHVLSSEGIRVDSKKLEATRLTTAPALSLPDGSDGYVIYYDASKVVC
ncbi:uncharacterized protein LOC125842910 [Solanum stenotomum]|uniref:uncharacterized protein LOC125842910 n=1 Tax=Solanum stenotomum TaxID=172797 RepID=UPI0020D01BD5|nr:uncharacterized protein LOC125842910 [Solanum stenotomum]